MKAVHTRHSSSSEQQECKPEYKIIKKEDKKEARKNKQLHSKHPYKLSFSHIDPSAP